MASLVQEGASLRDAFNQFLKAGLPSFLDSLGLPVGDDSTDTQLERARNDTSAGSAPAAPDPFKTVMTASLIIAAVGLVVFVLVKVFK